MQENGNLIDLHSYIGAHSSDSLKEDEQEDKEEKEEEEEEERLVSKRLEPTFESMKNYENSQILLCESTTPWKSNGSANLFSQEDESIVENEKLRRMRISETNRGQIPWNKGVRYTQGWTYVYVYVSVSMQRAYLLSICLNVWPIGILFSFSEGRQSGTTNNIVGVSNYLYICHQVICKLSGKVCDIHHPSMLCAQNRITLDFVGLGEAITTKYHEELMKISEYRVCNPVICPKVSKITENVDEVQSPAVNLYNMHSMLRNIVELAFSGYLAIFRLLAVLVLNTIIINPEP